MSIDSVDKSFLIWIIFVIIIMAIMGLVIILTDASNPDPESVRLTAYAGEFRAFLTAIATTSP